MRVAWINFQDLFVRLNCLRKTALAGEVSTEIRIGIIAVALLFQSLPNEVFRLGWFAPMKSHVGSHYQ